MASTFWGPPDMPITLFRLFKVFSEVLNSRSSMSLWMGLPSLSKKWVRISPTAPCMERYRKSLGFRIPLEMMVASSFMAPIPTTVMVARRTILAISWMGGSSRMALHISLEDTRSGAG